MHSTTPDGARLYGEVTWRETPSNKDLRHCLMLGLFSSSYFYQRKVVMLRRCVSQVAYLLFFSRYL